MSSPTASACRSSDRGRLLKYELVASYPTGADAREYFNEWVAFYQDFYGFPPDIPASFEYGFDSYKLTYCTVDAVLPGGTAARPAIATGMMSVPRRSGALPTVAYLHGTSVSFYDAVSNPSIFGDFSPDGESFDGPPSNAIFAGAGFIYIGPDYLGLGGSTIPRHRYFHAETEASSAIDLLAASRKMLSRLDVRRDGSLFVFGFSQGGHSALALHRELQRSHIEVTATATVGGVFDVERWLLSLLESRTSVTLPLYASYILLAYDDIYDVFDDDAEVFRRRFASTVPRLFDMQHFFDDVLVGLPRHTRALLEPSFYRSVIEDARHPLRLRLRGNAVDRWTPRAPLLVYHSPDDEEVPFNGALASVARLRRRGGEVSVEPLPGFDHVNSWIQAMPRAASWFKSFE
jgi:acetyl esterase/lipase